MKWLLFSPRKRNICLVVINSDLGILAFFSLTFHFLFYFFEAMVLWTIEYLVFAFDIYVKNNEFVTAVRREFRRHFNIHRNQSVPTHKTIIRWINALRTQGTILDMRLVEATQTVPTHRKRGKCQTSYAAESQSICSEASIALGVDNRSVRRILHKDQQISCFPVVETEEA